MFVEPVEKFAEMLPFIGVEIPRIQEPVGGDEHTFSFFGALINDRSREPQKHCRGFTNKIIFLPARIACPGVAQ